MGDDKQLSRVTYHITSHQIMVVSRGDITLLYYLWCNNDHSVAFMGSLRIARRMLHLFYLFDPMQSCSLYFFE